MLRRTSSSSTAPYVRLEVVCAGWPVLFHPGGNILSPPNRDPENPARSVEGEWVGVALSKPSGKRRQEDLAEEETKEALSLRLL